MPWCLSASFCTCEKGGRLVGRRHALRNFRLQAGEYLRQVIKTTFKMSQFTERRSMIATAMADDIFSALTEVGLIHHSQHPLYETRGLDEVFS